MTTFSTLISADELRRMLGAGAPPATAPILIDTSFDLADTGAGEAAWRAAHLPGSFYLHLERDLSGPKTGRNGRHPLPDRDRFAATLGRLGVGLESQVVVLDRQGGMFAARGWWLLRWLGHQAVAVLDGGVAAWVAAGGTLEGDAIHAPDGSAEAAPAPNAAPPYPERPSLVATIDADALARQLGRAPLIDARAAERFSGAIEPLDAAAGHIPGAANRFFQKNLDASGRFRPPAQLRADFEPLLGGGAASRVVHQCGSGVTACHNLLAMEHAGLTGSVLYPGSWSEWSADPARPVARGA